MKSSAKRNQRTAYIFQPFNQESKYKIYNGPSDGSRMIVAEFVIDHPLLGEALDRVPDIEAQWEAAYSRPDGPTQVLVWITSDDFDAVDAAIDADPLVRDPTTFADLGARRLYRLNCTEAGCATDPLPLLIEVGGVLDEAIGTRDGWWCRVRFPDRAAYQRVYRFYQDREIEFEFGRLVESTVEEPGRNPILSMLTAEQREALVVAWQRGYFDIPRRTTLGELAEDLGISDTAVSERLRRAHASLCAYLFGVGVGSHRRDP